MRDFYSMLVLMILNIALPYGITRLDRKRLAGDQLARSWNTASWASAVYFFGPLCLPAHFWVTRRTVRGLFVGAAWTAAVFALEWLIAAALEEPLAAG